MNLKEKTAGLSILSNSLLILMKFVIGMISGSVSIISEAIHSGMDLLAALIAFFAVRISDDPPDKEHPYGHGKFENISGVIEAILILVAAIWIIWKAIHKFTDNTPIESIGLGFGVMVVSSLVNLFVSGKLYKVAKKTNSIALEADALHLKADVYTSASVAAGLLLILISGYFFPKPLYLLDPVVAILVALFILRQSFKLLRKAFSPLVDISFLPEDIEKVNQIIEKHNLKYHNLRTRVAGNYKFIDFHLEFEKDTSVEKAQEIRRIIKNDLKSAFENADITIQTDTLKNS